MNMDIDFDFDSILEGDPIKRFLLHKLEEAKLKTANLEDRLQKRKKIFEETFRNHNEAVSNDVCLQTVETWQTIVDEKHVFGIELLNTSNSPLRNLSVLLPSSYPLMYSIKLYGATFTSNSRQKQLDELNTFWDDMDIPSSSKCSIDNIEWFETDLIEKRAILMIIIKEFVLHKKSVYEIDGLVKYEQANNKVNHVKLPRLNLSVYGALHEQVSEETLHGILASLSTAFKAEFFVAFTNKTEVTLKTLLSGDSFFKKIDVNFQGTLFAVNQSGLFGILQITDDEDGLEDLNFFFRNEQSVFAVLHYLYNHFNGILILPQTHKANYLRHSGRNKNVKNALQEFKVCLENEVKLAVRFFKRITNKYKTAGETIILPNSEEYKKFRLELADLELKTDNCLCKLPLDESE